MRSCRTNLKLKTQKRKFLFKAEELGDDCGDLFHLFTTQSMIKTFIRIYTSFVCFSMFHDIPTISFYEYRTRTLTIFIGTIQYVPAYKSQRAMNHYMECYPSNCWEQCIKRMRGTFYWWGKVSIKLIFWNYYSMFLLNTKLET